MKKIKLCEIIDDKTNASVSIVLRVSLTTLQA